MKRTLRVVLGMMAISGFFMVTPLTAFSAKQMFEQALQAVPQQDREKIINKMADRHIRLMEEQRGLQVLTATEKDQLVRTMASREIPLLQELNGVNNPSGGVSNPLMEKVRNQVMGTIVKGIVSHNRDLCMPIIQPYMTKEVSGRIRINTIPMFTSGIIERVKERFQGNRLPNS